MKWLHNMLKGISFTGALFVFQACYGTPAVDPLFEESGLAPMNFSVVSSSSGEPLSGIRVLVGSEWEPDRRTELGVTGSDGHCHVEIPYRRNVKGPSLRFEDPEGAHIAKDTVLLDLTEREVLIQLRPE
ncbi:MAG: hypothetical protein IJ651_09545 [Bacteroidales bacterium]|nr:hypothetical protein [Bacteroidales bacterium]